MDVIDGVVGLQSDGFADHESDCLGFSLTNALRRLGSAFLHVKEAVRGLVRQSIELLGGALAGQQNDFSARALALRRIDGVRVFELDATLCDKLL